MCKRKKRIEFFFLLGNLSLVKDRGARKPYLIYYYSVYLNCGLKYYCNSWVTESQTKISLLDFEEKSKSINFENLVLQGWEIVP